jgi:hypothetical protein
MTATRLGPLVLALAACSSSPATGPADAPTAPAPDATAPAPDATAPAPDAPPPSLTFDYAGTMLARAHGDFLGDGSTVLIFGGPGWDNGQPVNSTMPFQAIRIDAAGTPSNVTAQLLPDAPGAVHARHGFAIDLNGDGKLDFFSANHGYDGAPFPGERQTLLLSGADGKLHDASATLPPLVNFTHSAAIGDVRGAGKLDILVGVLGIQPNPGLADIYKGPNTTSDGWVGPYLLRNDGHGAFSYDNTSLAGAIALPVPPYPDAPGRFTASLFLDVDGAKGPDLVLGGEESSAVAGAVFLNDGTGKFTTAEKALPVGLFGARGTITVDVVATDLDGDGKPDLILSQTPSMPFYGGVKLQVLMNDGGGAFHDDTAARLPGQSGKGGWVQFIDLVDLDGDGDLDLHCEIDFATADNVVEWLNDGTGHFSAVANASLPHFPGGALLPLDLDHDGKPGLVEVITNPATRKTTLTVWRR